MKFWYHQQESNLYLALRRHSFCPLNYGGGFYITAVAASRAGLYALAGARCTKGWSVIWHCEDQIDRTLLTSLGADGEAFGQVVENVQRAQSA